MFSNFKIITAAVIAISITVNTFAIQSKLIQHESFQDFTKEHAQTENTVVTSDGKIHLSWDVQTLAEKFGSSWVINTMVIDKNGIIYLGTSPNGEIYKYDNKLEMIYTAEIFDSNNIVDVNDTNDIPDTNDPNQLPKIIKADPAIANKHVFAMALDRKQNLIAAISGADGARILRYQKNKFDVILDLPETNYVFSMINDNKNGLIIGTGPEGKIFHLLKKGNKYSKELIYDAKENSILSLALDKNKLYAGTDQKGLIYKIDLETKQPTVFYDSDETEITAIIVDQNSTVYAASTSEEVAQTVAMAQRAIPSPKMPGRGQSKSKDSAQQMSNGLKLQIANIKPDPQAENKKRQLQAAAQQAQGPQSHIYKITPDGLVEDAYANQVLFFDLAMYKDNIVVATGNEGQLFQFDTFLKTDALLYQDELASQILAVTTFEDDLYLATANPAKLLKISSKYASNGYYISPLIDAGQPAKWGKLQVQANIPAQTYIKIQARTGNVKDPNSPTFGSWTDELEIKNPVQLDVSPARFCQYKIIFETDNPQATPLLSQVALAYVVPNIAPNVTSLDVSPAENKPDTLKIEYEAKDENEDKLIYDIQLKKIYREKWITIEENHSKEQFTFDTNMVEDGRYEIKIIASDEKSNDSQTKLTGTRISDVFIIDNTPPTIDILSIENTDKGFKMTLVVSDQLSLIDSLEYTINGSDQWQSTLPEDYIYDTTTENFEISIEDIKPSIHLISFKAKDSAGNIAFNSTEVEIEN